MPNSDLTANRAADDDRHRGPRRTLVLGIVILAALVALFAASPLLYDVEREGRHLLPYPTEKVYEVEVANSLTVYVDGESVPEVDVLHGILLVAMASAALVVGLVLRRVRPAASRLIWFYVLVAAGSAYLAFDELFGIHETLGHNLRFLADLPGVDHPDDVVFALYVLPAFAFFWLFRDVILSSRQATAGFALALGLLGIAALSDAVFHISTRVEEGIEALSTISALASVAVLAIGHVSEVLPRPATGSA